MEWAIAMQYRADNPCREPGVHLGPHNVARAERGEPLERTADAVSVADRNQELAADRADVFRMEQALQHVRDEITKAVKALAAYARERLAQHRQAQLARERDAHSKPQIS